MSNQEVVAISLRIDNDVKEQVAELAKQEGRSMNMQLGILIKESLHAKKASIQSE